MPHNVPPPPTTSWQPAPPVTVARTVVPDDNGNQEAVQVKDEPGTPKAKRPERRQGRSPAASSTTRHLGTIEIYSTDEEHEEAQPTASARPQGHGVWNAGASSSAVAHAAASVSNPVGSASRPRPPPPPPPNMNAPFEDPPAEGAISPAEIAALKQAVSLVLDSPLVWIVLRGRNPGVYDSV